MTLLIDRIIFKGQENHFPQPCSATQLSDSPVNFAKMAEIQGYKCPNCHRNIVYFRYDQYGACCFCADDECMKNNSNASKGKKSFEPKKDRDVCHFFRVGQRYKNATLSRWLATDQQKQMVLNWMNQPKNMLILAGPPKTGKTYFCCAIGNRLFEKERDVYYLTYRNFFEDVQLAIGANQNQYIAIRKIATKPFLILDDLGASTNSDWQKEMILELIDQRYSNQLPTVITTNLSPKEIQQTFCPRTTRRLINEDNIIIYMTQEVNFA